MIKKGDKVKILSQKVEGIVEDILVSKFFNHATLKEEYSGCFVVKGKNTFYVPECDLELCEQEEDELAKYKRAFEIFTKDKELTLHKGKEPILGTDEYKLSFVNWKSLTKEEYKLLEELMKSE